jgi:hypothetical protein
VTQQRLGKVVTRRYDVRCTSVSEISAADEQLYVAAKHLRQLTCRLNLDIAQLSVLHAGGRLRLATLYINPSLEQDPPDWCATVTDRFFPVARCEENCSEQHEGPSRHNSPTLHYLRCMHELVFDASSVASHPQDLYLAVTRLSENIRDALAHVCTIPFFPRGSGLELLLKYTSFATHQLISFNCTT